MPIQASDIVLRYSAPAATQGGTTAGLGNGASLGKYCSNTVIPDNVLDNVFPDLTGDENAASNVDYQCIFVHNTNATLTLIAPYLWFASTGAANTVKAAATDNVGQSVYGATAAQAAVISTKNNVPTGVSAFSTPTSKATGLALGDLGPGEVRAVWIRRTATNSAAQNNDSFQIQVEGDTLQ